MKLTRSLLAALIPFSLIATALAEDLAPKPGETQSKTSPTAENAEATSTSAPEQAEPPLDPALIKSNASYGFGFRAGRRFGSQTTRFGIITDDLDQEAFMKGFFEAFGRKETSISEEDINTALRALQQSVQKREQEIGLKNLEEGNKFLAANGNREGVISTSSGLQYEIITKGGGPTYQAPKEATQGPDRTQFVVQYRGTFIDGTEFETTGEDPVTMGMSTVPGFREALTTMPTGSTWKIYLRPPLAYGANRRSQEIGPNSTLIFELTLNEIKTPPPTPPAAKRPTAVSPPVRIPQPPGQPSAPKVSPPVRVPVPTQEEKATPGEGPASPKE